MVSIFPLLIGYLMHNEVTRLTFSSVVLNGYVLCSRVAIVMSPQSTIVLQWYNSLRVRQRSAWSQRELLDPWTAILTASARSPAQTGAPAPLLYSRGMWQLSMLSLSSSVTVLVFNTHLQHWLIIPTWFFCGWSLSIMYGQCKLRVVGSVPQKCLFNKLIWTKYLRLWVSM